MEWRIYRRKDRLWLGKLEDERWRKIIRVKKEGLIGGIYEGYKFEMGKKLVIGVEGEIKYNDIDDRKSEKEKDIDIKNGVESKIRW